MEKEIRNIVCRYCGDENCDNTCSEVNSKTLITFAIIFIAIFAILLLIIKNYVL